MEALKEFKTIKFSWDQELIRSEPLGFCPFNSRYFLELHEFDEQPYLRFSEDIEGKYLMEVDTPEELDELIDIYFNRLPRLSGINPLVRVRRTRNWQKNPEWNKLFKYDNNLYLFCGLDHAIEAIENSCCKNDYLYNVALQQASTVWNESHAPQISAFRTVFSDTQFIFAMYDNYKIRCKSGIVHPLILVINYNECDNQKTGKYPVGLPLDAVAALDAFNIKIRTVDDMWEEKDEGDDPVFDTVMCLLRVPGFDEGEVKEDGAVEDDESDDLSDIEKY